MARKLKIALVMGGGVSLGSFNGGALAETIRQLVHNRNPRWDSFEIDVLSGASAGGMTLALLLRTLAQAGGKTDKQIHGAVMRAQHDAWVERINIDKLISDPNRRMRSLLDRGAIDDIAKRKLPWNATDRLAPAYLANRVLFGMTLLNYNGLPIDTSALPALKDAQSTTLFRDFRCFCLDFADFPSTPRPRYIHYNAAQLEQPESWKEIAATAIAGGAFPGAFEPVVVKRHKNEYGPIWPNELQNRTTFPFTYGDGGTFNNEPLSDAMDMIGYLDREDTSEFDRLLIYIDPHISGPNHDFSLAFQIPYAVDPGYGPFDRDDLVTAEPTIQFLQTFGRFAGAVMGQARYKDLQHQQIINNRLEWRDELRDLLASLITSATPEQAENAKNLLNNILNQKQNESLNKDNPGVQIEMNRIYRELHHRNPNGAMTTNEELLAALFSAMDQVAGLRAKRHVQVIAIAPTEYRDQNGSKRVELAGNFLANFGGFFERDFRVHDFLAGEAMAGSVLAETVISEAPLLKPNADRPEYIPYGDKYPAFKDRDPQIGDVPKKRELVIDRCAALLQQLAMEKVPVIFLRELAGYAVNAIASKLMGNIGEGVPMSAALVKINVTPASDDDVFYLEGASGGDGPTAKANGNGVAELCTLVLFNATTLEGLHVHQNTSGCSLKLGERKVFGKDTVREIKLPIPGDWLAQDSKGLCVCTYKANWGKKTGWLGKAKWNDELRPLAETL